MEITDCANDIGVTPINGIKIGDYYIETYPFLSVSREEKHFRVDRIIKQDGYNETIYYLFNDTEYTDLRDLVSAIYLQEITDYYEKYNNARAEWEEANNRWHKYVQDKQDEYNKTVGG